MPFSETCPLRSGAKQGCLLLSLPVSVVLEVLAKAIRQEKVKQIQRTKNQNSKKYFYFHIHSSIIHNNLNMDAISISIAR